MRTTVVSWHGIASTPSILIVSCARRKREYKIKNLEAEGAKIAAKERSEGGLTQGQAATLVCVWGLSLIHTSDAKRLRRNTYDVFGMNKKKCILYIKIQVNHILLRVHSTSQ